MLIRRYTPEDKDQLFLMLIAEGPEWSDYYGDTSRHRYEKALDSSHTFLAYEGDVLCGYARCREDDGFGVYVYDLLVAKPYRGRNIGRRLMEQACREFPDQLVYVMSDVDAYYEKLGYAREGSIFIVSPPEEVK